MSKISITNFAMMNHFSNPSFSGTKIGVTNDGKGFDVELFMDNVNKISETEVLHDGFAPFVKHLFVENFTGCRAGVVEITERNRNLLKTGYLARKEGELAVLGRYFESKDVDAPSASWLDIILYSKEQLAKEGIEVEGDWGIVAIKGEMVRGETPPVPVTIFRNAIGTHEGGNGAPLDREAYNASVEYWDRFATVK
tara:strand:+ start:989 stop:1576 length:588 start_codon:yes stop_codon:yes gene_type:complete